jgi:hypothetical protein
MALFFFIFMKRVWIEVSKDILGETYVCLFKHLSFKNKTKTVYDYQWTDRAFYIDTETKKMLLGIGGYLVFRMQCNAMSLNLFFTFFFLFIQFLFSPLLLFSIDVCVCRCERVCVKKRKRKEKRMKFKFDSNRTIKSKVSVTCILRKWICMQKFSCFKRSIHLHAIMDDDAI